MIKLVREIRREDGSRVICMLSDDALGENDDCGVSCVMRSTMLTEGGICKRSKISSIGLLAGTLEFCLNEQTRQANEINVRHSEAHHYQKRQD